MTIKPAFNKENIIASLTTYHDALFTPGVYEHSIYGQAALLLQRSVEVVHGRWEHSEYHGFLRCSKCKDVYIDDTWVADGKWNYCPNCGAKMDGGNQNE